MGVHLRYISWPKSEKSAKNFKCGFFENSVKFQHHPETDRFHGEELDKTNEEGFLKVQVGF